MLSTNTCKSTHSAKQNIVGISEEIIIKIRQEIIKAIFGKGK